MTLLACLTAFVVAACLTRRFCDPASPLHILDHPNERSLHSSAIPRSGGVALLLGVLSGGLLLPFGTPLGWADLLPLAGALPVAWISFLDDRRGVGPLWRLAVHGLAAVWLVSLSALPGSLLWLALLGLAVVWTINLYNFMDGMDGFAGGMAVIGFSTFAVLGYLAGAADFTAASLLVAGAALGFLLFNFPPARIFMGDTGASTLGFLVAAFALWGVRDGVMPLWLAGLVFSPFMVDATVTLLGRLWRREKVWQAHRSHYYQRLVQLGWGHRRTVLLEYGLMLLCGLTAVSAVRAAPGWQAALLVVWLGAYIWLIRTVGHLERADPNEGFLRNLLNRLRNRTAAFVHDAVMVPLAWFGAYWLRFNLEPIPEPFLAQALALLPLVLAIHAGMFWYFGLYRGIWRFASLPDFMRIIKAVLAAAALSLAAAYLLTGLQDVPRSAFVLHSVLLLLLLGLPRFCYRWAKDHRLYYPPGRRVLIVGAGQAGEVLVRELLRDGEYQPIAFVDDDVRKRGTEVRGVRVLGACSDIPALVARLNIDLIFIAIPRASAVALRRIVSWCEASDKPFRALPRWRDLLAGHAIVQELREVSIEDLLGREPVSLDWETIRQQLSGRTVLVSGGGGSIGSELCRQVASLEPAALIVLERSEYNLYAIERELRARFPGLVLHAQLTDICDTTAVDHWLGRYRPTVVFHAAAYKHVPLLEEQAREAVRNNLFGTVHLAEAADRHGVSTFVLISTDKAVNPVSVMGASKRLAEMYCQNFKPTSVTRFVTVRFGNVLGSAGSVVPLFRDQIRAGGPVTVTDPQMTRYFMTIPEASQLIMQAGAVGAGREIYVLDMGEPINIADLAEQMILLSGKTPHKDIAIEYTGLRPGEKLSEELFHSGESLMPTSYPKLLLAQYRTVEWLPFQKTLERLRTACERYDEPQIRLLIEELVPELKAAPPVLLRAAHA